MEIDSVIAAENAKASTRDALVKKASEQVRAILLSLDNALESTGARVEGIDLDTRRFANFAVTISTADRS